MPATLTVTPDSGNSPPRNRVDVTVPAGSTAASVLIMRTDPDGRVRPMRLADPASITGTAWVGYDYEVPFGGPVAYSAAVQYSNPGSFSETIAVTATLPVTDIWLIHPGIPALSIPLANVTSTGDRVRAVKRGIFEPFGRSEPIIVTDGKRKAPTASLTIRTQTLAEKSALEAITADAATLLLNIPDSLGWGVSYEYLSLGDLVESREVDIGGDQGRLISGPYHVTSRPIGGSQSQRTWNTLMAECATWADVLALYPTWLDVLAPTV